VTVSLPRFSKANRTLPQIDKLLAEAAAADAAEDARYGGAPGEPTPRTLAPRAGRRQRAKQEAWDAAAAAGKPRGRRPGDEPPRPNRNNTEPRANITDSDVRVMRNQKGYVAGYNGQLVVTAQQVIAGAVLSQHPVDRTLLHPVPGTCRRSQPAQAARPPPQLITTRPGRRTGLPPANRQPARQNTGTLAPETLCNRLNHSIRAGRAFAAVSVSGAASGFRRDFHRRPRGASQ
jgi:hypothetical protein